MKRRFDFQTLPYNHNLKERAKELRNNMNYPEKVLWYQLKGNRFKELDFHRQKVIGDYIVDFYCPKKRVVIEIDGKSHIGKDAYDEKRDVFLKSNGLTVIHIDDRWVLDDLTGLMKWLIEHPAFHTP